MNKYKEVNLHEGFKSLEILTLKVRSCSLPSFPFFCLIFYDQSNVELIFLFSDLKCCSGPDPEWFKYLDKLDELKAENKQNKKQVLELMRDRDLAKVKAKKARD